MKRTGRPGGKCQAYVRVPKRQRIAGNQTHVPAQVFDARGAFRERYDAGHVEAVGGKLDHDPIKTQNTELQALAAN